MRIAMIGQKGIPARDGGVERHVHDLAMRLNKNDFEVSVYSRKWYTRAEDSQMDGVNIIHVPTIHTKHFDTILHTFMATIHAMYLRHDIIHYHGVGPSLLSWIPRVFSPQIKIVTTFHSMDRKHEKWGWFAKLMLRMGEYTACKFAHTVIAVSPTIEQYVRDVYDRKAIYIPNAVNMTDSSTHTEILQEWDLQKDNYILMVSRLIPHKGAHYLIDAWKKAQEEKPELLQGKKLVIVGDGYYTDEYVTMLKAKAIGNESIVFTGFQTGEKLKALYSFAQIQVHPSDNEGLPMCVLEGMSFARPVILSNIPEHRDLNGDPDSLFQYGSVNGLKNKIISFLSLPQNELSQKGNTNRHTIEKQYTWDTVLTGVVDVYNSLSILELQKQPTQA